jgi:hypothetical protein
MNHRKGFLLPLIAVIAAVVLVGGALFLYAHHKAPSSSGAAAAALSVAPAASATFVSNNTTTSGSWKGTYGSDGYFIHGDEYKSPSYVSLNIGGNSNYTWSASTESAQALEKETGNGRIASSWYTTSTAVGSSFTIDANVTDGKAHEITLYALDWDKNGRKQHYVVENATTGAVLDTRSISSFQNGVYTSWTITGHVKILVVNDGPTNAVVSGVFFEPAAATVTATPTAKVVLISTDTTTSGNWKAAYGVTGYDLHGDQSSIPSYATVKITGATDYTWTTSTSDTRALQKVSGTDRLASAWYSQTSFTIDINVASGTHEITLYALDWDSNNRTERIDVIDAGTGTILNTQNLSSFHNGEYVSWDVSGHVQFKVTNTGTPAILGVVSGIFFGGPPEPSAAAAGTISGIVFNDVNKNGVYDTGDTPLSGWGVWINANTGGQPDPTGHQILSDSNGNYSFSNLVPGTYIVDEEIPTGYTRTVPTTVESPGATGYSVTVTAGGTVTGKNFGSYLPASTTGGGTGTTTTGTGGSGGTGGTGTGTTGGGTTGTGGSGGGTGGGTGTTGGTTITVPPITGTAPTPQISAGQAEVYTYSENGNESYFEEDTSESNSYSYNGVSIPTRSGGWDEKQYTGAAENYLYNTAYNAQCQSGQNIVYNGAGNPSAKTINSQINTQVASTYSPASTVSKEQDIDTDEGENCLGMAGNSTTSYWSSPVSLTQDPLSGGGWVESLNGSYSTASTSLRVPESDWNGSVWLSDITTTQNITKKETSARIFKMAVGGPSSTQYNVALNVFVATSTYVDQGPMLSMTGLNAVNDPITYYNYQYQPIPTVSIPCGQISIGGVTATSSSTGSCTVNLSVTGSSTIDVTPQATGIDKTFYYEAVSVASVTKPNLIVFLPGVGNETDGIFGQYGRMTDLESYLSTTIPNFSSNFDTLYVSYGSLTNTIAQDITALDTALKNQPNIGNYQNVYIVNHSLGNIVLRNAVLGANGSACAAGSGASEQVATDPILKPLFAKATMLNIAPLLGSGDSPLIPAITQYFLNSDSQPQSAFSQCEFSSGNDKIFNNSIKTGYDYTVSSVGSVVTGGTPKNPTQSTVVYGDGDPALDGVWDYMAVNKGYECTVLNANPPTWGPLTLETPPLFYNSTKDTIWYNDYEGAVAPHHTSYYGLCILPGEGNALLDMTQMNTSPLSLVTFANNTHFILLEYKPVWDALVNVMEGK